MFLERHKLQKFNKKQVGLRGTKMMAQKSPELPSSMDTLNVWLTTQGEIPSEKNPETNWVTPIYQVNEKIPTSK